MIDDGNDSAIFTWGLNNSDGRLGLGSVPATPKDKSLYTEAVARSPKIASDKRSLKGIRESSTVEIPLHCYEPTQITLPLAELSLLGKEAREVGGARWKFGEVECGDEALYVALIQEDLGERVKGEEEEANY